LFNKKPLVVLSLPYSPIHERKSMIYLSSEVFVQAVTFPMPLALDKGFAKRNADVSRRYHTLPVCSIGEAVVCGSLAYEERKIRVGLSISLVCDL
jgi:hypothetical protein